MLEGIRVLDHSRVIADVDVTDPTGFAEYRALVPATLEPYRSPKALRLRSARTHLVFVEGV